MKKNEVHPMLRSKRPLIITGPGERLAGDAKNSIEMGADAIWVDSHGRFGKTYAYRQLVQTYAWRPFDLYMAEYTYTRPTKPGEGYFFSSFLLQDGQTVAASASSNSTLMRVANMWRNEASRIGADTVCIGINEANRLTMEEFEHIVSIGNELEKWGRAFFFFINQTDAAQTHRGGLDKKPPRHIAGRYFTTAHHFTGLLWDIPEAESEDRLESDVALAFREYDEVMTWPVGSSTSFTEFFAPNAWASGWRLGSQTDEIRRVINAVRAEHSLGEVVEWPMLTFERFVYYVLVRIAHEDPTFNGLTETLIRDALVRVGYLEIEPEYMRVPA